MLLLIGFFPASAVADESKAQSIVPGKVVLHSSYGVDYIYLQGNSYKDVSQTKVTVEFTVEGLRLPAPLKKNLNGYYAKAIELIPQGNDCRVVVTRKANGRGMALSVISGSRFIPSARNVLFSLTYGVDKKKFNQVKANEDQEEKTKPTQVRVDPEYPMLTITEEEEGKYELPPFPQKYKYSDALVSLTLQNADFRDVLMLLSEIGGVSIVLDPYWNDEPTGGRRPPGGPGGGEGMGGGGQGQGGGGGGSTSGFREADIFQIRGPMPGTGNLTLNFENVPFDLALDLVLTAMNLEKIDVYPGFFDVPVAAGDVPEHYD